MLSVPCIFPAASVLHPGAIDSATKPSPSVETDSRGGGRTRARDTQRKKQLNSSKQATKMKAAKRGKEREHENTQRM